MLSKPAVRVITSPIAQLKARILLAEDVPDLRAIMEYRLKSAGAEVACVENGQKAVEWVRRTPDAFDLVLMDIQMPVMDGYEATRSIRESGIRIPIIACSARLMTEERERGAHAGVTDYLGKPVNMEELVRVCKKYVSTASVETPT